MEKVKITTAFLKGLKPGGNCRFADSEVSGLQVRVSERAVTFYIRKRQGDKIHETAIGRFPDLNLSDARKIAMDKLSAIANFRNIDAPAAHRMPLVCEAVSFFIADQANKASAQSILNCFSPLFDKKISDLKAEQIERIFHSMKDTPSAANHAVRYLKTAFRKLFRKLKMQNPAENIFDNITQYPSQHRTRILTEKEAPSVITRLKEMTGMPMYSAQATALLMMIYTGQRKSKVLQMAGTEIDTEYRIWHVPGNNIKRPVDLPLNDFAWEIVQQKLKSCGKGFFFTWKGSPLNDCRKTMLRACRDCGISDLHIHDLRRSLGSWMLSSGSTIEEVSKTLGHSSIRVTEQVYAHLLQSTARDATNTAIAAMSRGTTAGNGE